MALYGPLKSDLSRYRRRKKLSTDGSIQGAYISKTAHAEKSPVWNFNIDLPHRTHEYDPAHAAYDQSGTEYDPPQPWFEGMHVRPTGQIRFDPVLVPLDDPEKPLTYSQMLKLQELIERMAEERGDPVPSPIEECLAASTQAVQSSSQSEPDSGFQGVLEIIQAQEAVIQDAPEAALPEQIIEEPSMQGLEQIVEQEFSQMGAVMQPPPEQMVEDPFEQQMRMYNQQMQQMLAPFMMQGGFGPQPPGM